MSSPSATTYVELKAQIEELQRQADQAKKIESAEVLARIKEDIKTYGFVPSDFGLRRKYNKSKHAQKAPDDSQQPEGTSEAE